MSRARSLGLALLALGCARTTPRVATSPVRAPPVAARGHAPVARAVAHTRGDTGSWWVDARGTPRRAIVRGWRVELDGEAVQGAGGWFGSRPRAVWERDGVWRFAGRDAQWEARTFLGGVSLVASATTGFLGLGSGRAAVVRDGRAEGVGLPPGVVLDVAFGDDSRGVALLEPNVVLHTENGGARWAPVRGPDEAALELVAVGDRRWIRGDHGCYVVDDAFAARPCPCDELPLLEQTLSGEERGRLDDAAEEHFTWSPLAFTDPSRRRVLVQVRSQGYGDRSRGRAALYDVEEDEMVADSAADLPCEPGAIFSADRPYLTCIDDDGAAVLWSLDGARWRERLRFWTCDRDASCAVSASGERVTCEGRCAAESACGPATTFCERVGEQPPRASTVGSEVRRWRVAGYDGEAPVLLDRREWLAHAEFIRGHDAPALLAPEPPSPGLRVEGAPRLGSDGRLRFWAASSDGRRLALEGTPGARFVERASPPWAREALRHASFSYCDADGVAMARDPDGALWRSMALGDPWRVVALENLGPLAEGLRRRRASRPRERRVCDALGWGGDDVPATVVGWGRIELSRWGASAGPLPRERTWESEPVWRCSLESAGAVSGRPMGARPVGPYPEQNWVEARGVQLSLWSFQGATSASPAPRLFRYRLASESQAPSFDQAWSVISADARSATILVWARSQDGSSRRARLLELSPSAPPRWLADPPGWTLSPAYLPVVTLVARDGLRVGALTEVLSSTDGVLVRSGGLLSMAPGAPLWSRRVSMASGGFPGVYVLGDDVGLARVLADGRVVGGAPGELPRVLARATRTVACGPSARGAFTFPVRAAWQNTEQGSPAVVEYAVEDGTLCLRALRALGFVAAPGAAGVAGTLGEHASARCDPPGGAP